MADTPSPMCSVCSIRGVTTGLHYGAVTCYACRAFFRRCPDRKRTPRCKYQSMCPVNESEKQCVGCRLKKCFRWGRLWSILESLRLDPVPEYWLACSSLSWLIICCHIQFALHTFKPQYFHKPHILLILWVYGSQQFCVSHTVCSFPLQLLHNTF